jgi:hypothetical protein
MVKITFEDREILRVPYRQLECQILERRIPLVLFQPRSYLARTPMFRAELL